VANRNTFGALVSEYISRLEENGSAKSTIDKNRWLLEESYIAKDNSSAAFKASVTILATINRIAEFPQTSGEADTLGVRMAPILPYRYLLFFSIVDDTLVIRNVRHSRQRSVVPRN
jgi:plasmid stabilization system protein ParE